MIQNFEVIPNTYGTQDMYVSNIFLTKTNKNSNNTERYFWPEIYVLGTGAYEL